MTRLRQRLASACALLLLLAATFPAAAAKPAAPAQEIDALLARAIPADGPGVAVIAVKDGKTVSPVFFPIKGKDGKTVIIYIE